MGSGRKYRDLGDKASEQFLKEGQELNEAVQKLANENDLNEHEVQRVVEHANVNTFLSQFKEASDKTEVTFDVADADAIDAPSNAPGKEASVTDTTDYLAPPDRLRGDDQDQQAEERLKRAQASKGQDRSKEEWVDHLKSAGVSDDVIDRFVSDWEQQERCGRSRAEAEKVAMRHVPTFALDDAEEFGETKQAGSEKFAFDQEWANDHFSDLELNSTRSIMRARSKLATAREELQDKLAELEVEGQGRIDALQNEVVETMKQGASFDTVKEALARLDLSEKAENFVKVALDEASDRKVDLALWQDDRNIEDHAKTAALNEEHPLVKRAKALDDWADSVRSKQAEVKRVEQAINTIDQYHAD